MRKDVVNPLMRKRAVAAASQRAFGTVTVIAPPSTCMAWLTAVAATGLLALAAFIVELPVRVTAAGVLMPPGGFMDVVAPEPGIVTAIRAKAGQEVAAAELLIEIGAAGTSLPGEAYPQISLRSLTAERKILSQTRTIRKRLAHERLAALAEQESTAEQLVSAARRRLSLQDEQASLLTDRLARTEALANAGHLSRDALEQQALSLLQIRERRGELKQQLLQLETEVDRLGAASREANTEMRLAEAEQRLQAERIEREIGKAGYRAVQGIRATGHGVVASILVAAGSSVRAGQVVAKLYRPGEALEAWLYLSTASARLLAKGQSVRLLLDAYPKETFGVLEATVSRVSPVALTAEEVSAPLRLTGPVFEARARLAHQEIAALGRQWTLLPGTTFRAEVIQQRLRLYEWLMRTVADA